VTVTIRDQYGDAVLVPELKVEIKAIPTGSGPNGSATGTGTSCTSVAEVSAPVSTIDYIYQKNSNAYCTRIFLLKLLPNTDDSFKIRYVYMYISESVLNY